MSIFTEYGFISDDPIWASVLSSIFHDDNKYFPIISLPRMNRDDWQVEVYKRTIGIIRTDVETFFCKGDDYGLLAPLRSSINQTIIPLGKPEDVFKFIQIPFSTDTINANPDEYLSALIQAKLQRKTVSLDESSSKSLQKINHIKLNSNTAVVIEKSGEISDVVAVNYAFDNNYDIYIIDALSKMKYAEAKSHFRNLSKNPETFESLKNSISSILLENFDFKYLEQMYSRFQFFVKDLPLGIFIESKPTAHLDHLQSDLRVIDERFYLEKQKRELPNFVPSFLFIDIQSKDLVSEVPVIEEEIVNYKYWSFHLNGKYANKKNFNLYSRYFPFDLVFVSGHGSSPDCRKVIYKFKSRDGKEHFVKLLEYYQFGQVKDEMVEVETKEYFLEFDGINWEDKKAIAENGLTHILLEYMASGDKQEVVEYEDIDPESIEGLLLSDGIYLGIIHTFSAGYNPIVFFNTCGSLIELGNNINFAGPRSLLGTMWSIYDSDAGNFAKEFFKYLPVTSISEAFFKARNSVEDNYTKFSYVYWGTLNSFLPMNKEIKDDKEIKQNMAKRLINSLSEAIQHYNHGFLEREDMKILLNIRHLTEQFVNQHVSSDINLKQKMDNIRSFMDSSLDNN